VEVPGQKDKKQQAVLQKPAAQALCAGTVSGELAVVAGLTQPLAPLA
jgi:hypothetical protein